MVSSKFSDYIEVPCSLCGSNKYKIFTLDDTAGVLHPRKVKCTICGLVYANPQASFNRYEEYYSNIYAHSDVGDLEYQINYMRQFKEHHRDYFKDLNSKMTPGKFLDVGCSIGSMVQAAQEMGWEGYGVELSKTYCNYAKNIEGIEHIFCGDIFSAQFKDNYFNHIYMWHVIEHVTDPKKFLMEIQRILKPGGELVIGTPHINGFHIKINYLLKRLRGAYPKQVTVDHHTYEFSPKTIKRILKDCGFLIINLECYWPTNRAENINRNWKGKLQDIIADIVAYFFPDTKGYHMRIECVLKLEDK